MRNRVELCCQLKDAHAKNHNRLLQIWPATPPESDKYTGSYHFMLRKLSPWVVITSCAFLMACQQGFERFAPPANSISGRGAKVHPKILVTTPAQGANLSPVTGANGTEIKVQFDMTMRTDLTPVIRTYAFDQAFSDPWITVANSGYTWVWSSTAFANDTLTLKLGWVYWPENNLIGFDFDVNSLQNLDDMTLAEHSKITFTVGWNPGRYKVVTTGNEACYYYSNGFKEGGCLQGGFGDPKIGTYNYPAGQNGFFEPMNGTYGVPFYGSSNAGIANGRRFPLSAHPQNLISANCNLAQPDDSCYPYSIDKVTTLVWKTCSQGQPYKHTGDKCYYSGSSFTWGDAVNACSALNTKNSGQGYGGRKDWRLPTIYELETLVDFGARIFTVDTAAEPGTQAPAIHGYQRTDYATHNEGPFPNTSMVDAYWTATGFTMNNSGTFMRSNAYLVEFKKGHVGSNSGMLNTSRASTNLKKVRCVSGPGALPQPQNLVPKVEGAGAALVGKAAAFTGPDSNATFNVVSATPNYDIQSGDSSLTVEFNRTPNGSLAGLTSNYSIMSDSASVFGASLIGINTATPIDATHYKLGLATAMGANTAYKVFVQNVQTTSDLWQTGKAYTTNMFLYDAPDVYKVFDNHTSTTVSADVLASHLIKLNTWQPSKSYKNPIPWQTGQLYTAGKLLSSGGDTYIVNPASYTSGTTVGDDVTNGYLTLLSPAVAWTTYGVADFILVPGTPNRIVQLQYDFTSSTDVDYDISIGMFSVIRTLVTDPVLNLNQKVALFNGPTVTAANIIAPTVAFDVERVEVPNLTTVKVTFNALPDTAQATNTANYCIISPTASPWDCTSASLAPVTGVTLSGYTATLTTNLVAGTAYAVLAQNITYAGSNVVDDSINKLRWQRCRAGTFDSATCSADGDNTNDEFGWNSALNYCDALNGVRYDGYGILNPLTDRFRWRAPTINELKSISNRALFGTAGVSMDLTVFPTPQLMAEKFISSTSYAQSGGGTSLPNYDRTWVFNFFTGFTDTLQRDYETVIPDAHGTPKGNIRCVRSLP